MVNEKYQSIRNLVSKDKNIGTQEISSSKVERKATMERSSLNHKATMEELDGMLDKLEMMDKDKLKKVRSYSNFEESERDAAREEKGSGEAEFGVNRWECLAKIDAHGSGVLAVAAHEGCLISTASKSIKVWDLETRKLISELAGPQVLGSVRYVSIDPERRLFYTACEKLVTIWDLTTLEARGTLKSHRDEVRVINQYQDYLFTGGKGSPNGGSLLIWDMRKLSMNQPLEEK